MDDAVVAAVVFCGVDSSDADGGSASAHAFIFQLYTSTASSLKLVARYSVLRRMFETLLTEHPEDMALLPEFPQKLAMQRQTPSFLQARGKQLETFLL